MVSLFDALEIDSLKAKNRLFRSAIAESLCTLAGCPSKPLLDMYVQLAQAGVGTIITGYSYFMSDGKPAERSMNFCDDSFASEYKELVGAVHKAGARIVLQLVYGGTKSKLLPDDKRILQRDDTQIQTSILGPSDYVNPQTQLVARCATPADLSELVHALAQAALRAKSYGFDGVEIHSAHGYLLSQFLSPLFNTRDDEYGGSVEARAKLVCDCVQAARKLCGENYPIFVKLNAWDTYVDPQGSLGGLSQSQSFETAKLLALAGASALEISGDWHKASKEARDEQPYFGAFATKVAASINIPVILTGGFRNPAIIEAYLNTSKVLGIGMARPLIREPHLLKRWLEGDTSSSLCVDCGICLKHAGIPCPYRK